MSALAVPAPQPIFQYTRRARAIFQPRSIIHINVADFAVAVEQALDTRLRGRPVIIAPGTSKRTEVFDMSEEAFSSGVRKGMRLPYAQSLCRDAELLSPSLDRYERATRALLKHAQPYSPLIECADENGHLFIDVTGTSKLSGPPPDVAWRIRNAVRNDLGFDLIWSVAPNKLLAKTASRLVKPTGEYIVEAGDEESFLNPLPLQLLPGLESNDLRRMREFDLRRVRDVTQLNLEQLEVAIGKPSHARHIFDCTHGIDPSPVRSVDEKPPIASATHLFGEDSNDRNELGAVLFELSEALGAELRSRRLAARRLGLILDYCDGTRIIRSATTATATTNDFELFRLAKLALQRAWTRRVRVRHLRLNADRLIFPPAQLLLFPEEQERTEREERLVIALDKIRAKFGKKSIQIGRAPKPASRPQHGVRNVP